MATHTYSTDPMINRLVRDIVRSGLASFSKGNGHGKLHLSNGHTHAIASTPSDRRAYLNLVSDLKKKIPEFFDKERPMQTEALAVGEVPTEGVQLSAPIIKPIESAEEDLLDCLTDDELAAQARKIQDLLDARQAATRQKYQAEIDALTAKFEKTSAELEAAKEVVDKLTTTWLDQRSQLRSLKEKAGIVEKPQVNRRVSIMDGLPDNIEELFQRDKSKYRNYNGPYVGRFGCKQFAQVHNLNYQKVLNWYREKHPNE